MVVQRPVARIVKAAPSGVGKDADEQVVVGKHRLRCRVYEETRADGPGKQVTVRTWVCPSVPLGGTLRIEHNGKTVYELLDFGQAR
jgi:hypothetical protein